MFYLQVIYSRKTHQTLTLRAFCYPMVPPLAPPTYPVCHPVYTWVYRRALSLRHHLQWAWRPHPPELRPLMPRQHKPRPPLYPVYLYRDPLVLPLMYSRVPNYTNTTTSTPTNTCATEITLKVGLAPIAQWLVYHITRVAIDVGLI